MLVDLLAQVTTDVMMDASVGLLSPADEEGSLALPVLQVVDDRVVAAPGFDPGLRVAHLRELAPHEVVDIQRTLSHELLERFHGRI